MKLLLITLLVAYVSADVSHVTNGEAGAKIIRQISNRGKEGQYLWLYETENGITAAEQGRLRNPQSENAIMSVLGLAKWIAPDGQLVEFEYGADENGYRAVGSHIPI